MIESAKNYQSTHYHIPEDCII